MERQFKQRLSIVISIFACAVSCLPNPLEVDVSNIPIDIKVNRIDRMLFENPNQANQVLDSLHTTDSAFVEAYAVRLLQNEAFGTEQFREQIEAFVFDSLMRQSYEKTKEVFQNWEKYERRIRQAFKYYKYYYPDNVLPNVYVCLSGFNVQVFLGDGFLGVALDMFLGRDNNYYEQLRIDRYRRFSLDPSCLVNQMMYLWATEELFPYRPTVGNVLEKMLYEGQILYFLEAIQPTLEDSIKMGFTSKQLKWCEQNEYAMWDFLLRQDILYSVEPLLLFTYTGPAPFTQRFGEESPGQATLWLGWQIIRSYMKNNPEVSLRQLMQQNDYNFILSRSGYKP